jgi:hypothetical protein
MSTEQNNEFIIYNTTKEIPQNITYLLLDIILIKK